MEERKNKSSNPKSLGEVLGEVKLVPAKKDIVRPSDVKLVKKALEMREKGMDPHNLGFTTPILVQANFPHDDPGSLDAWIRTNGDFCLSMQPLIEVVGGKKVNHGYPYGSIPRLILIYMCTQVIKYQSPEIDLGRNMSEFMSKIGIENKGGLYRSRVKDQTNRLLTARIHCSQGGMVDDKKVRVNYDASIAAKSMLWWDNKKSDEMQDQFCFDSCVVLRKEFFDAIKGRGVPINLEAIAALRNSCLAIDLYTWLTYRVNGLSKCKKDLVIKWGQLASQVGADYKQTKEFGRKVKSTLRKIELVWPELKVEEVRGGFKLKRSSRPHVKRIFTGAFPAELKDKKNTEAHHRGY